MNNAAHTKTQTAWLATNNIKATRISDKSGKGWRYTAPTPEGEKHLSVSDGGKVVARFVPNFLHAPDFPVSSWRPASVKAGMRWLAPR